MSENVELVKGFVNEYYKIMTNWNRYLEDEDIPTEERWEVFQSLKPLFEVYLGSPSFDVADEHEWDNIFGMDSGDTTPYDNSFIEIVGEYYDLSEESVENLKNQIMREGYSGFRLEY